MLITITMEPEITKISARGWFGALVKAPLWEEFVLRGPIWIFFWVLVLFRCPRRIAGVVSIPLILASGIYFGLIHVHAFSPIRLYSPLFMAIVFNGILFGWLTIKTKNIVYPILAHIGVNLIACLKVILII